MHNLVKDHTEMIHMNIRTLKAHMQQKMLTKIDGQDRTIKRKLRK